MRGRESAVRQHRVAAAQQAVRKRELRIEHDGVLKQGFHLLERSRHRRVPQVSRPEVSLIRVKVRRVSARRQGVS